jgi:hypothetical protein
MGSNSIYFSWIDAIAGIFYVERPILWANESFGDNVSVTSTTHSAYCNPNWSILFW